MNTYSINEKKYKKALTAQIKAKMQKAGGGIKFCRFITYFLRILGVVLGIATVLYAVLLSDYLVEIIFAVLTFGIPFGISFIFSAIYKTWLGGEYKFRRREELTVNTEGLVYSYHDDRSNTSTERFSYNIHYCDVSYVDYKKDTQIITIHGDITEDRFWGGALKETTEWAQVSLLNAFDIDVISLLREKNMKIKEI